MIYSGGEHLSLTRLKSMYVIFFFAVFGSGGRWDLNADGSRGSSKAFATFAFVFEVVVDAGV